MLNICMIVYGCVVVAASLWNALETFDIVYLMMMCHHIYKHEILRVTTSDLQLPQATTRLTPGNLFSTIFETKT